MVLNSQKGYEEMTEPENIQVSKIIQQCSQYVASTKQQKG